MSDNKATFSSVLEYFRKNYNPTMSGRENIKLNGRTSNPTQFHKKFLEEKDNIASYAGLSEFYGAVEALCKARNWSQEQALQYMSDQVFGFIRAELNKEAKAKVTTAAKGAEDLIRGAFNYQGYLPVLDIKSKQRVLYNTKVKSINRKANYDSWKDWVNTRPSEERKLLLSTVVPALIKYDPDNVEEVSYTKVQEQEEVLTLNAHVMPSWRMKELANKTPPKEFTEFMNHLFPDKDSQDYVLHWMNFMITKRNHCILFLHGEQGVGKGTFSDICERLVGIDNYVKVGPEFWESRFNGELKYRRCVFFDENEITKENVTRVRAMTNRVIAVEDKGSTLLNLDNHASYIWAINPDKKALITYDDRRYSVPLLGKENIERAKSSEWMDNFTKKLEDKEFIAGIGWWILNYGDQGRYNTTKPYITEGFYQLVDKALTLWQRNVVELIESRENDKYDLADTYVKEILKGTGRTTLQGFLDTYRDKEGECLGYVTQGNDKRRYLVATTKYFPEDANHFNNEEF